MMRMYELFLSRNQTFNGEVSVAGHSLGKRSVFQYDLILGPFATTSKACQIT